MQTYKIAPTDLTFLLNDCPKCFHHKVVNNYSRPYSPFPSVFNKIDKCMTEAFAGASLSPELFGGRSGTIHTKSQTVKSKPQKIGDDIEVFISGRDDAKALFESGDIGVIDFKASSVKEQYRELYWRQLMAYATALMDPAKGVEFEVTEIGLITVTPQSMNTSGQFNFELGYVNLGYDQQRFYDFLSEEIYPLLTEEPEGKFNCPYCALRDSGFDPKLKEKD